MNRRILLLPAALPSSRTGHPLGLPPAGLAGSVARAGKGITTLDLLRMHQGGLRDATILEFIQTYQATLMIPDTDWVGLGQAGLAPGTIQALREHALANPDLPPAKAPASAARAIKKAPLPRFFVGYSHDPAAFPSWYYPPFTAEDNGASPEPGRGNPRANRWRDNARAVWFHGRRL